MSYLEDEREELQAMMNMFVAIKKLKTIYSMDQAIDIMDEYLKTGNEKVLMNLDDTREFVKNSNFRDTFLPIYDEGYDHLHDYINDICPSKKTKSK